MINLFVSPSGMERCTACPPIAKTGKTSDFRISNHENSDGLISIVLNPSNRLLVCLTSLQYDENVEPEL
jgi:hypothetical protein